MLDDGSSPASALTEYEMFFFLPITVQVGHCIPYQLTDYWATMDQFYKPLYSNMLKRDGFIHIICFLHFSDNRNEADGTDENYDRLYETYLKFCIRNFQNFTTFPNIWQ
jgi:hypothetical protein